MFPGWMLLQGLSSHVLRKILSGEYEVVGGTIRKLLESTPAKEVVKDYIIPAGQEFIQKVPGLNYLPAFFKDMQIEELTGKIDGLASEMTDVKRIAQFNKYCLTQLTQNMNNLSLATQQVLQLATGTAILSGLGLIVSSIGFLVINKKLNMINCRLKEIQKDVRDIRIFLERTENAALYSALDDLLKIEQITNESQQEHILLSSREKLKQINFKYREYLAEVDTIGTALTYEEYFCLTALAQTRCSAELGNVHLAHQDLQEMYAFWKTQAQRISKHLLIGNYPERFLATDFAKDVPLTTLVQWLDFANNEEKGYSWIDDLRIRMEENWYGSTINKFLKGQGSGLNKNEGIGLQKEKEVILPSLHKLLARNNVFQGYISQYEMLDVYQLKPSEFDKKVAELPKSSAINGYFILAHENDEDYALAN